SSVRRWTRRALLTTSAMGASVMASEMGRPATLAHIRTQPIATLPDATLWPGDPAYEEARRTFNLRLSRFPAAIAYCTTPGEVQGSLLSACQNGLAVSIRSGGHGYEGYAVLDYALVLDLSGMNQVNVDLERGT